MLGDLEAIYQIEAAIQSKWPQEITALKLLGVNQQLLGVHIIVYTENLHTGGLIGTGKGARTAAHVHHRLGVEPAYDERDHLGGREF
jgi:hypothetical protein